MLAGMHIKQRLKRLEKAIAASSSEPQGFEAAMANAQAMWSWLDDNGFDDCLAAVEAKATPPIGLERLLASQAKHDPRQRAWKRVERALDTGELPEDADVAVLCAAV